MMEAVGRLLQAYKQFTETSADATTERRTLQVLRRERLRQALSVVGTTVSAETAAVLADGLATGQFAITDTAIYLWNDGSTGIKADCHCKSSGSGCQLTVTGASASCNKTRSSTCRDCGFTLGLTVPTSQPAAVAGDPAPLGQHFLDQLPAAIVDTAHNLTRLTFRSPTVSPCRINYRTGSLRRIGH
jgi:hypothetical protein